MSDICFFSFLFFFIEKPYKLRGVGSDGDERNNIVLLEEAAFIKEEIRNSIILPLLTREGSVLLTISTLGPIFDSWKRITEATDERGRPVFTVKTYSLVCDDCIEKGLYDKCMHKQDILPRWQSADDEAKVKAIMKNDPDTWRREALGIQGEGGYIPAFEPRGLAFLMQRSPPEGRVPVYIDANALPPPTCMVDQLLSTDYQYCFIAVDPAAGGNLSNYAIMSTVFETNGTIVVRNHFLFPLHHSRCTQWLCRHLAEASLVRDRAWWMYGWIPYFHVRVR